MADVKWIKVTTDVFDDEKILLIESLPSSDSIITIWFKLLTLAGKQNNNGVFLMSNRIPYTDEMLATIFRREISVVRLALNTFQQFGMIEVIDNVITIPNWNKHQTLDAYEKKKERDRLYQQKRRDDQKMLIMQKSSDTSSDIVISEEDKEEDKEKEEEREKDKREIVNYQQIVDMYNETCISLPRVKSLSDARKKSIKARLNKYSLADIQQAFTNAEESDFLKGSNGRNWQADFDWIMKDANIAKVLDGNYANRNSESTTVSVSDYIDRWRDA